LLVIAVVAIILLGPDRLPQVARQVGGAWRSFNEFRHRMESEVRSSMPDLPPTSEIARPARSPSALLNHLSNMSSDEEPDGTFQPPAATEPSADSSADIPADSSADIPVAPPDATAGPPPPAPTPIRADDPTTPPRAPGVVVPGDPNLN
jgi:sec-independent protein translocase protein TatB